MRVLLLGGTGSIGGAVLEKLQRNNHEVVALARSEHSASRMTQMGARTVMGDIKHPSQWIALCDEVEAVVHAAASWDCDMGVADRRVVQSVLPRLSKSNQLKTFIYTGGCWLYGQTGDIVATETSPVQELESFSWTLPSINDVLCAENVRGMVIHPAMVYEHDGGVFEHIYKDARELGYVRVVESESVRWPLVHRIDLADLYVLMLKHGRQGDVYNAAANEGVPVGVLTRAIAAQFGITQPPVVMDVIDACREIGDYAEGYALDQQMSSAKAKSQLGWRPQYEDPLAVISE